jgi:hypothetical protein
MPLRKLFQPRVPRIAPKSATPSRDSRAITFTPDCDRALVYMLDGALHIGHIVVGHVVELDDRSGAHVTECLLHTGIGIKNDSNPPAPPHHTGEIVNEFTWIGFRLLSCPNSAETETRKTGLINHPCLFFAFGEKQIDRDVGCGGGGRWREQGAGRDSKGLLLLDSFSVDVCPRARRFDPSETVPAAVCMEKRKDETRPQVQGRLVPAKNAGNFGWVGFRVETCLLDRGVAQRRRL